MDSGHDRSSTDGPGSKMLSYFQFHFRFRFQKKTESETRVMAAADERIWRETTGLREPLMSELRTWGTDTIRASEYRGLDSRELESGE